jgi:hypothetical protein
LSEGELDCLAELQSAPVFVKRDTELVREGQTGHMAYIRQRLQPRDAGGFGPQAEYSLYGELQR